MTDQTPLSLPEGQALDESAVGPRLYGVIDVIKPERIAGWVIDRTDPGAFAEVELRREGRSVAVQPAQRPRKDLQKGGVGTGCYGFSFPLDPPLDPGMEFTIEVMARSHDGVECPLQPTARAAGTPSQPEQKLLERVFSSLTALRTEIAELRAQQDGGAATQAQQIERIEMVQLRIEAALEAVQPPEPKSQRTLWIVAAAGLAIALVSLVAGVVSLIR